MPIEHRTCKHLRAYRGEAAERERIGSESMPAASSPAKDASGPAKDASSEPKLLLAQPWDNDADLTDWWMSEKLDGVRAWWDGKQFLSRQGNIYHAPDWFVAGLPAVPLDGELWLDRKAFQRTVSIVRRQDKSDHWREIKYLMFDAPAVAGPFEERQKALADLIAQHRPEFAKVLEQQRCKGVKSLKDELARIEALGGEGLMLRQPGSAYEAGRSFTLLKVKTFHDAEGRVIEHLPGKGRHKGRLGAVVVELPDGTDGLRRHRLQRCPAQQSARHRQHDHVSLSGAYRSRRTSLSFVRARAEGIEEMTTGHRPYWAKKASSD